MISTEELSQLLATLYAAPLQPEKWQIFFDHLARLIKVSSGYFISGSLNEGYQVLAGGGLAFNPETTRLYNEYYVSVDPFAVPALHTPRVAVIRGEEMVSQHKLTGTELYNDLLCCNHMEFMTLLSCTSATEQVDVMSVWRRRQDGPMEDVCVALLETLLPHACTALKIRRSLHEANAQDLFAELSLEAINAAVILVSAAGNVIHMNKMATSLVNKGDGLRMKGMALTAQDSHTSARLSFLIAQTAASRNGKGVCDLPGGALEISRRGYPPLLVAVLPVPEKASSMLGVPCGLVFVIDSSSSPRSRAGLMRTMYGLTPAESRLADLLLEGLEVRGIADSLGITIETTRFYLKRVLAKTGTRRQSELMKLMLSLPGQ